MSTTTPAAAPRSNLGRYIGLGFLVVIVLYFINLYNGFIREDEIVKEKWATVESSYKMRYDLYMNLVETVKGSGNFEQKTLTDIVEQRAKATQITIDPATATPEQLKAFTEAQSGFSSSFGRLLAVVESYPNLKTTEAYNNLMVATEGTERRINVARIDYNEAVKNYNTKVRRFPANMVAGIFGFKPRAPFEAEDKMEDAPKFDFGTN